MQQKRLATDAPVPCIVRAANDAILVEDDSLAEIAMRENLHPLDQFRAMHAMAEKGVGIEDIAANFFVTPAVVRQRLKLASVSPTLHEVYADGGMSLEQLMAFTVGQQRQSFAKELVPARAISLHRMSATNPRNPSHPPNLEDVRNLRPRIETGRNRQQLILFIG